MSQSFECKCSERKKPIGERAWYVTEYKHNSFFQLAGGEYSDYSTVWCVACQAFGRTKAGYVSDLLGMYDDVNYECACPVCGSKVEGFQSKDGECVLDKVEPSQVDNFYASCKKCGCWIDFSVERKANTRFIRTVYGKGPENLLKEHTKEININEK